MISLFQVIRFSKIQHLQSSTTGTPQIRTE